MYQLRTDKVKPVDINNHAFLMLFKYLIQVNKV